MTDDELNAYLAEVRARAAVALAKLESVDVDQLPPALRSEYDGVRAAWEQLLAMSDADVLAAHVAACLRAGRDLTPAEARALLLRQ